MFSAISRKRSVSLTDELGSGVCDKLANSTPKHTSLQLCVQLGLILIGIVVVCFGLAMVVVGVWGYVIQKKYLVITDDDTQLTRLPFSMMATGTLVTFIGLLGMVGSVFSRTLAGQTLLGVFSFILVLIIISEVGAGIAAIKLTFSFEEQFVNSSRASLRKYGANSTQSTDEQWDNFQKEHKCCGVEGFVNGTRPYHEVFMNNSVPTSCCCQDSQDCETVSTEECEMYAENATYYKEYFYQDGCPSKVIGKLRSNLILVATIAITIGFIQLMAIAFAVIVVLITKRETERPRGTYSYKKLCQQENSWSPS